MGSLFPDIPGEAALLKWRNPLICLALRAFGRLRRNQHAMWITLWILWKTLLTADENCGQCG